MPAGHCELPATRLGGADRLTRRSSKRPVASFWLSAGTLNRRRVSLVIAGKLASLHGKKNAWHRTSPNHNHIRHVGDRIRAPCRIRKIEVLMNISEYLQIAHTTDRLPTGIPASDINPRLGLAGETGYLLTVLKKEVREDAPTASATIAEVTDELGDMLWYATCIAKRANVEFLDDVIYNNIVRIQNHYTKYNPAPTPLFAELLPRGSKITEAVEQGPRSVTTFNNYQTLAIRASRFANNKTALVPYLVQIWQNVGDLLRPFGIADDEHIDVAKCLGDIMWYIAGFAALYGLSLDDIAEKNARKILSAFPPTSRRIRTLLYDEEFNFLEQIPRSFNVDFFSQDCETAVMLINDVRVGDPLTDNAYTTGHEENQPETIEGYRYHDAIHLAFAAVLGWSPVIRSLLKRKRKSKKIIDQVEDGARAIIVEEMIVKISHSYAIGHDRDRLLDGKQHVNLNLLKQIVGLAEGLEVAGGRKGFEGCKYWEWQEAIISGFTVYNELRRNNGGRVLVDLNARSITYEHGDCTRN